MFIGPGPSLFLFIFVFSIQLIIKKCSIKFCGWLVSKATALPTAPQPLPNYAYILLFKNIYPWLAIESHMTSLNQSDCIIINFTILAIIVKFAYVINSWTLSRIFRSVKLYARLGCSDQPWSSLVGGPLEELSIDIAKFEVQVQTQIMHQNLAINCVTVKSVLQYWSQVTAFSV